MKKRALISGIIAVILATGFLLYFKPLRLTDLVNENHILVMAYQEFEIKNGLPYIINTNYNEITQDEKSKITDIFTQCSYKRTFKTIFSDGSLKELSDRIVNIYIYDENNQLVNTILITDSDNISVNGKAYALKNSSSLINELLETVRK